MKCGDEAHFSGRPAILDPSPFSVAPTISRPFRSTPFLAFGGVGEVLIGAMGEFATKSPYKGEYVAEFGGGFSNTSWREIPEGCGATSR